MFLLKKERGLFILMCLLWGIFIFPDYASGQTSVTIKGAVLDKETAAPIIGASIKLKERALGTFTDNEGNFQMVLPANSTIIISYVGYKTQEKQINNQSTINVFLEKANENLSEVVVIGYGGVKKKDLTGSVTVLKPDELNRVKATTTTDLLLGKVAGLQVTLGSGSPGSSGTVRIRQGASLNASNEPLIVVDGLTEGSLSSINPNDIESITILKDASASAIYGARGANGIIIVKTKRGNVGINNKFTTPEINIRGDLYINQPYKLLDVYGADEFRTEYEKRGWNRALLGNANTNWQEAISRTSVSNIHSISLTGAMPYTPYRFSGGYNQEQGNVINTKREVATTALTLSPKFLKNHLSVEATVRYTYIYTPNSGSSFSSAALTDPTQPIYFDYEPTTINGVEYSKKAFGYFMYGADDKGNSPQLAYNPVASATLPDLGNNKSNRLLTNLLLSYKVHGFEDLTLNIGYNGSSYNSTNTSKGRDNMPGTWSVSNVKLGKGGLGIHSKNTSHSYRNVMDYYLNYKKEVGVQQFDLTLGHTYEMQKYSSWYSVTNYNDGSMVSGSIENSNEGAVSMASWFSRLNYKLLNRFLFTATMRADASSRFAPETRWGYFPSAAFAWDINDEKFMKNIDNINELKFRVSYGSTGQQNINNDYAYQATYYASTANFMYREGDEFYITYRPSAFDRSIKWEVTQTANIGLDYGFFKNRLYGSADYYRRYTSNLLMNSVKVAAGSNFAESIDQNIGEMSSRGFEFAVGGIPIRNKNLTWNLNFNFAYNESKIEKLTVYDGSPEKTWVRTGSTGASRTAQFHKVGNTPNTYYLAKQVFDENGKPIEKFYNPNYDPNITGSQEFVTDDAADASKWDTKKSSLVPNYGGFSTSVKYKSWDFGTNMHYAFGQYVYWNTMSSGSNNSFFDPSNQYPTNTFRGWAPEWSKIHYFSDYWLFKGDYLKIDNIVIGYTFNKVIKQKSSFRLGAGIQNVATITHYPGVDPEMYSGIDDSSTPKQRMYMISLNFKF
jgi:TonB-linked SusC/RagA family outer membrane protein